MKSETVRYEVRTKKVLVNMFDTPELARKWLEEQEKRHPNYVALLKLYKVTTITKMEAA